MSPKSEIQQFNDQTIEPLLSELRHEFESMVSRYKLAMRADNLRREYKQHAALTPYITKHPNGYFYAYWARFSGWRTVGNQRVRNTAHIRTNDTGQYTEKALRKYARDWEIGRVLEMERAFQLLRKRQSALGKVRLASAELLALLS